MIPSQLRTAGVGARWAGSLEAGCFEWRYLDALYPPGVPSNAGTSSVSGMGLTAGVMGRQYPNGGRVGLSDARSGRQLGLGRAVACSNDEHEACTMSSRGGAVSQKLGGRQWAVSWTMAVRLAVVGV
jgi:hypothetical protein